jgi:hypothetical protein
METTVDLPEIGAKCGKCQGKRQEGEQEPPVADLQ